MAKMDLPCADCGRFMWRVAKSLPEGEARCHPCRRAHIVRVDRKRRGPRCAICGDPLACYGKTVLPEGTAICLTCRRARKATNARKSWVPSVARCKTCRAVFTQNRWGQVYCNERCRSRRVGFKRDAKASRKYQTLEHRQARARMLNAFNPGDPCCLCGQPMYPPTSQLHADHDPSGSGYRGLAHALCNIKDGARRARARQNKRGTSLEW